uniref:FHA domain-containing protein n=1 Tax=Chenopodium quinoa TaxID=63459 RepID=A0A803LNL8_CHEQI
MAHTAVATAGGGGGSDVEAGFAKLQGEDFEYYMQTYSIILGRNSKKSTVDVDLASLGGGMNISRHHARIFYDFQRRRFALEVLGKNGCLVEGVLHLPGNAPVKLDSQDLLQIGDKEFYFLLPVRNILEKKSDGRSRVNPEADNQQLMQLEEKDVVSSVATVLSDLCGPGEWMPMEKLHTELMEQYGSVWHHTRVRRYLSSEDFSSQDSKGKPWDGLLALLRKYPEHFVINTRSKNRVTLEFVSLVSLLS